MTLIYKPIGLVFGLLAGFAAKKIFTFVWSRVDDEEPPSATTQVASWPKLLIASALQGAIFYTTRVVVSRYGAQGWAYLTGSWPGERRPEPKP